MTREYWLVLIAASAAAAMIWWLDPPTRDCEHAGAIRILVCGDQP